MTTQEIANIVAALTSMKVKPKADTPEDFRQWMTSLSKDQEPKVKKEPQDLTSPMGYSPPSPPLVPYGRPAYQSQYTKIATFSGDVKNEAAYDLWKYEVECLLKESYHPDTIHQAIRRSQREKQASHHAFRFSSFYIHNY